MVSRRADTLEASGRSSSRNTEYLENVYSTEGLYPYPKRSIISSNLLLVEEKNKVVEALESGINADIATAANVSAASIQGSNNGNFP